MISGGCRLILSSLSSMSSTVTWLFIFKSDIDDIETWSIDREWDINSKFYSFILRLTAIKEEGFYLCIHRTYIKILYSLCTTSKFYKHKNVYVQKFEVTTHWCNIESSVKIFPYFSTCSDLDAWSELILSYPFNRFEWWCKGITSIHISKSISEVLDFSG